MISFDELILGGCKFYALRKNATSLCKEITIAKCKGYKKSKGDSFTFEDFEQLSKGGIKKHRLFHCRKKISLGTNTSRVTTFLKEDSKFKNKFSFVVLSRTMWAINVTSQ